jgi:hypothetical protein
VLEYIAMGFNCVILNYAGTRIRHRLRFVSREGVVYSTRYSTVMGIVLEYATD